MGVVAVFLGTLALGLGLAVPIGLVLIFCAVALMFYMGNFNETIIVQQMVMGTNNGSLLAIPFFMLAGELMAKGGLSIRIVNFANLVVGRFKGGLGYVVILSSILFAGLSGSAVADAAALGGILIPIMKENNYNAERATGLVCSGAVIAPIIPPSIPMIVLATGVGVSVGKLFMAGIVPGLLLGMALMIVWKRIVLKDGYTDTIRYEKGEGRKVVKNSLLALFMPVMIVGGIRLGVFTPTEAGAFAAVYAFIISVFVYKELPPKKIVEVFVESARSTGIVMFIVAAASAVAWLITIAQIPAKIVQMLGPLVEHPVILLLTINLFLFIMGMVMDLTPNLLIFGPILFPVVIAAGIDPIFFGVIMVLNLTIGLITPPVGTILYLGCRVGGVTFEKLVKGIMPFLLTEIIVLLVFTLFPQIILFPLELFY